MDEILGILVGVVFTILGLALLTRLKKLTTHKYYRYILIVIGVMLISFGLFMAGKSVYFYG